MRYNLHMASTTPRKPVDAAMPGVANHLRRYAQATARVSRHQAAVVAASRKRSEHVRALLDMGFSERAVAAMIGLGRAKTMRLAAAVDSDREAAL